MQTLPLVSVIISCYNHERYIEESILSVINQTYANIELIVIDDGSKDNSVARIQGLQEKYHFIFEAQTNMGVTKTLNKAISTYVTGQYIAFLASDDYWHLDKIERQVNYLNEHQQYDLVFSNAYLINDRSEIVGSFEASRFKQNISFEDLLLDRYGIPALTVMVRKSIYEQVGLYDENLMIEDWDMWLRIAEKHQLAYVDEKLAYYRTHDSNISSKLALMMEHRFLILNKWAERYPEIYQKAIKYWRTEALVLFAKHNKKVASNYISFNWDYLTDKKYRRFLIKYLFSGRFKS